MSSTATTTQENLVIICLGNVTSYIYFTLARINPKVSKVTIVCKESNEYVERLPRFINLEVGPFDFWTKVKSYSLNTVVVAFHEKETLLFNPDAIAIAASVALGNLGKYVGFVDSTGKADSLGVVFLGALHFSVSFSPCLSFATTVSTLLEDKEVIEAFWNMHPFMFWSTLQTLRNRKCLSPIPSLAATLPLDDNENPPGVNWKQLQDFIEKGMSN
jgi:hypothetical protein